MRESIFEEDTTAQNSLDNILRHKAEYEKLADDLKKLNEEKELLQKIEQQYQRVLRFDAEAVRRQIAQKKYQFMKEKTENDELEQNISDLSGRLRVLDQQEKKARKAFDAADQEFIKASTAVHEGQRPIEELKEKLRRDEESRDAMEESVQALQGLRIKGTEPFWKSE